MKTSSTGGTSSFWKSHRFVSGAYSRFYSQFIWPFIRDAEANFDGGLRYTMNKGVHLLKISRLYQLVFSPQVFGMLVSGQSYRGRIWYSNGGDPHVSSRTRVEIFDLLSPFITLGLLHGRAFTVHHAHVWLSCPRSTLCSKNRFIVVILNYIGARERG